MVAGTWARSPCGVVRHGEAGAPEVGHQGGQVLEAGRRHGRGLVVAAEEPDGAADVGHRLPADPLGVAERGHRVVQVGGVALPGGVLDLAAGRGEVQHRDAQRVGDQVVHLAADAVPLLEHRLPLADRVLAGLGVDAQLLGAHHEPHVEADRDPRRPDADLGSGEVAVEPDRDDDRLAGDRHRDPAPESRRPP